VNQVQLLLLPVLLGLAGAVQAQNPASDRLVQFASTRPQLANARAIGTLCFAGNRLSARLQDDCNTLVGNAFGANPTTDVSVRRALAAIVGDNATIPIDRSGLGRSSLTATGVRANGPGYAALLAADAQTASLQLDGGGVGSDWSLYVNARVDRNERERSDREDAFDEDGRALTVGFDLRTGASAHVGAAVIWGQREIDYGEDSGALDTTDLALNLYANWQGATGWHAESLLALTRRDYEQLRRIAYGLGPAAVDQRFDSRFDGEESLLALGGGYAWNRGASTLDPYLRVEVVDASSDGYTEVSRTPLAVGAGWAMEVDALDETFTRGVLGLRAAHAFSGGSGVWTPYLDLSWIGVSGLDAQAAQVRYAGDRSDAVAQSRLNFLLEADKEDNRYGSAALGLSAQWANGWSGFAGYRQNFSENRYRQAQFDFGLRREF